MSLVKRGYCVDCQSNHRHVHRIRFAVLRILDRLTFHAATWFRIGAWHCDVCNRVSFFLRTEREENPVEPEPTIEDPPATRPVGNFIRRDLDLVAQADRLDRFSPKFRDSILERVLSGKIDVAGIREELNIPERDLFAMVREKLRRLEARIESLEQEVQVLTSGTTTEELLEDTQVTNSVIEDTDSDIPIEKTES